MTLRFNAAICGDPDEAQKREWLETNGLGGYASSTIIGLNTRRYHGLLMAATKPPCGRTLLLSKFEETLIVDGQRFELSANRYPGVIHPQGFQYLIEFRLDPFPVFVYQCGGVEIEKRVFMVHGGNATVIEYDLPVGCSLDLRPLIAFRDFHSTTHENSGLNREVDVQPGVASVQPYADLPALHLAHNATAIDTNGDWYHNIEFAQEEARGLDFREDLFNPMTLRFDGSAIVIASTDRRNASDAPSLRQHEILRRAGLGTGLARAADQFIVARGDLKTIIAGYHWFSDWGRDTMIAFPGLTLATGRFDVAKSILLAFANAVDQGMIPNRFPDAGETPEYNTVDATLWYFEAVRAYLAATGDHTFVMTQLFPKLVDIIDWHVRGTRYGIHVDTDGLLACGEPGVQLTWMDAKVGDWVVTPRHGKPVEIQALWYNALQFMESLSSEAGYGAMADQARVSFNALFWNDEAHCLYDVIGDASIRPNQVFAVSLHHSMLAPDRARAVVERVRHDLLTPMGLRTLAPSDPQYQGKYGGGVRDRDAAYHQGTVWPWLMGPFITAFLKTGGDQVKSREWLNPLLEFMAGRGVGQLPEVADGDAPHEPGGCIAQAWSVGEVLRVLME